MTRLLLLTDRAQLRLGRGLVRTVAECVAEGLGTVVVREHDLPEAAWSALVERLGTIPGLEVLTSRRRHPGAAGVHLAAHQPVPAPGSRHGRSCHGLEDLRVAAAQGARWATLSPWAPSPSKPGHGPSVDPAWFGRAPLPTYALGGIDHRNAADALAAGASGVAVMGAVMRAADPAAEVARLLKVLR